MLKSFCELGLALFALKIAWGAVALRMTIKHLRQSGGPIPRRNSIRKSRIFIVIPLLREQARFEGLLGRFSALMNDHSSVSLVLVTTEREEIELAEGSGPTTSTLIHESTHFAHLPNDRRFHFHYPQNNDTLSEQIAYGVERLYETTALDSEDYILLYNADSVVGGDSMQAFIEATLNGAPVVQQSSLFVKNLPLLLRRRSYLAAGDAIFQSGWTLVREIPRYLIGSGLTRFPSIVAKNWFAHCVGHGLLIRVDLLMGVGGFRHLNCGLEDSCLGYLLRAIGQEIQPLALLEIADAAPNSFSLMRQKAQWIRGPLGSLEYYRIASVMGVPMIRNTALLLQGVYSGLKWGFGILILGFLAYACLAVGKFSLLLTLYVVYCLQMIVGVLLALRVNGLSIGGTLPEKGLVAFCFPVVPLLHGISGLLGVCQIAIQLLRTGRFRQVKTEMV